MKKLSLTLIGLYLLFLHGFSQASKKYENIFLSKPLKLEEINLVTSYYSQTGSHSAVTGGGSGYVGTQYMNGSEQLTDFANNIELKLVGYGETGNKHTILAGLGIDHHTAASQRWISATGASSPDGKRIYPSLNWTVENTNKGTEFGIGTYYSHEYNYNSIALDGHVGYKNKTGGEFGVKVSAYFDKVKLIYPSDSAANFASEADVNPYNDFVIKTNASRGSGGGYTSSGPSSESEASIPSASRNTYTASFTYSQVINQLLQAAFLLDLVKQDGFLSLPFHRVIFNNGTEKIETLPSSRTKIPFGVRLNYFATDDLIVRSYYRFYTDDWGLTAHTASLELPYKITPFLSVSPFYRYYTQTATKFFAVRGAHAVTDNYYTSNYASSAFNSHFFGLGFRTAPPDGVANTRVSAMEIRYGHYSQSTDLTSNVISLLLTLK
jgi:hypothetical protein